MIRSFVLRQTGDPFTADDCTSETFARALASRSAFQCRGDGLRPWLYTIARNLLRDFRRSARHRTETPVADVEDTSDGDVDPQETVVSQELCGEVRDLVSALPDDQAACVRLRFFCGLSVRETAIALRKSDAAVRAMQYRAVRSLAGQIQNVR